MRGQNHRRKNIIGTINDADDRQYLSVPVMVPWGPRPLTLVRLNKMWRIGVLVLPMWRTMPEMHAIMAAFNLFVTSASVKTMWYVKVRSCTAEAVRLEACGHPNEMPSNEMPLRGSAPRTR